ncbi:ABC transporter permease [Cohnella pontilimi]|uniref:Transport permease protein n=1 Tax=Cohnella pontilimi TaxID=2564100 RepID=A0A4U0FIR1_9BACL|nr:ABC transporter permease [Cohnella pontilimi]TJY43342.1 ABC transporter permease [Cohnella pontilimi]
MSQGKQFGKLFSANIKMMFREKQVWFWNLFFPIILMSIFILIFGGGSDKAFKAKVAVVKPEQSQAAEGMYQGLKQIPVFTWQSEEPVSQEQADSLIKNKDVDGVIVLPDNGQAQSIKLIVNRENETSATSQALRGILDHFVTQANFQKAGITPAFKLETDSITSGSEDLSSVDFLMTGMIALAIAQGGLFGMVDLVEMRRKGLLKRLRMTPVRMGLLGLASMLVRFVLGVVQIAVLTVIGVYGFGAHLHLDIATLIVAFFIGSLAFNAIGYLISSFSKSLEAYMGVANIASFLMMFISGIFFPVNSLPDWLQSVTSAIPLTYFVEGLRDGMVYGEGLVTSDFWFGIGVLALWGAIAYMIGATLYRRTKVEVR